MSLSAHANVWLVQPMYNTKANIWRPVGWFRRSLFGWPRTFNVFSNAVWLLQPVPVTRHPLSPFVTPVTPVTPLTAVAAFAPNEVAVVAVPRLNPAKDDVTGLY